MPERLLLFDPPSSGGGIGVHERQQLRSAGGGFAVADLSTDGTPDQSRGPWEMCRKDEKGQPFEASGVVTSVWRRQVGGSWRGLFDDGGSLCAACRGVSGADDREAQHGASDLHSGLSSSP